MKTLRGWYFQPSDPMGGAAGEAYANTLKSAGLSAEHLLAREAIQNSVDAGLRQAKVLVVFREREFVRADKKKMIAAAGLRDIGRRADSLELPAKNCLPALDVPETPLRVVYVEDYNAQGLSGNPHDKGSNFYRLLLSLGDRSKSRGSVGSGGSYGYGKSVYSSASSIQTIFAYTRFIDDVTKKPKNRIFGCGYYASHEFKKEPFSGRAFYGTAPRMVDGYHVIDPLENDQADDLGDNLGFRLRKSDEYGTSILIIDSPLDMNKVNEGVEEWWWPRLVEDRLDVRVELGMGEPVYPRPKRRDDLMPFIEAFDVAVSRSEPRKGIQRFQRLNAFQQQQLGTCGFMVVPITEEGPVVSERRLNAVALIRAPRMVVHYAPLSSAAPPAVGVFVAHGDVDEILKKAEPPAHNDWDANSVNLSDEGRQVVDAVLNRIRGNLRRFQAEAAPPPPPKQKRLSVLERALGSYFRPIGGGGNPPPPPSPTPLRLEFTKTPHAVKSGSRLKAQTDFAVRLDDGAASERLAVHLRVACSVLEEDHHEGDELTISFVHVQGVKVEPDPEDPAVVHFHLKKGERAKFSVESAEYDATWSVRMRPEITAEAVAE